MGKYSTLVQEERQPAPAYINIKGAEVVRNGEKIVVGISGQSNVVFALNGDNEQHQKLIKRAEASEDGTYTLTLKAQVRLRDAGEKVDLDDCEF